MKGCGSKHHLSWDCPDSTQVDKKKLKKNKNKGVSAADGVDETSQATASSPSPAEPHGGGGKGTKAKSDGGGEAADVGPAVRGERESNAKQRKPKKAPAQHVGGDDLEDDDYYDPEDVPGTPLEPDAGTEDLGPSTAKGRGGAAGGATTANKKSKVVVF